MCRLIGGEIEVEIAFFGWFERERGEQCVCFVGI